MREGEARLRLADWLSLAAAPAFAAMALFTSLAPDRHAGPLCGQTELTGMAPMYLLMAVVHLAPWLRLPSGR